MLTRLTQRAVSYTNRLHGFNRNGYLCLLAAVLNGISQGIFSVVFNLYILSLGIEADILGRILSAAPFAQALGSIPAGFIAETIGFKKTFLIIYTLTGIAKLTQVSMPTPVLISIAAFIGGLGFAGDFVVRLPFLAANTAPTERAHVYSLSSILFSVSMSLGALLAGYIPELMRLISPDLTIAYRYTLYSAGVLTLSSLLPITLIHDHRINKKKKISLYPYLWGIDRFTVQSALVSLFVGLGLGLTSPFLNIYFIYHLGASREFFSTISALAIIPITAATALAPLLAARIGRVTAVTILRCLIPSAMITMALTSYPLLGAAAFWIYRALFSMSQPLSFAFTMDAAAQKAKAAVSAWLNVTFWLGIGIAAPITGLLLARSSYGLPFYLSSIAIVLAGLSNQLWFARLERKDKEQTTEAL